GAGPPPKKGRAGVRAAQDPPPKFLLEAGRAPAAIDQVAIASGPGRMGLGVDVEGERVPLLTIGRVGFELGAVRHRHLDAMIVGMKIILLLHDHLTPPATAANSA